MMYSLAAINVWVINVWDGTGHFSIPIPRRASLVSGVQARWVTEDIRLNTSDQKHLNYRQCH